MSEVNINYKGSKIAGMDASGTKTLLTDGKYCEDDITVEYTRPSAPTPSYQSKTKSYTPSETAQSETVTADSGYDALSQVSVSVGAVSSTYVGSGITRRSSTDLTASGATVTVPSGYYSAQASKAVSSGSAGTPTATKGTVSNHSVSVTPSVTNTTGYITGSTKTGTAVAVSASELVSGSETKTSNGTYDVTNLAQLIVNVAGGGGSGLEYETGTWTPSSDIARGEISFANSHTEAPVLIYLCDVTGTKHSASNSNYVFMYADPFKLWGNGYPYSSSGFRYANAWYCYRGTSTSSIGAGGMLITNKSSSSDASSTAYPRYWATESKFYPYTNGTSRYWRAGRTFKWIAVWNPTA